MQKISEFFNSKYSSPDMIIHAACKLLLLIATITCSMATLLHYSEPEPHLINLIIPPVVTCITFGLYVYLCLNPDRTITVLWAGLALIIIAMLIPSWYFTALAYQDPEHILVKTLPPVTPIIVPVITGLVLYTRSRTIIILSVFIWIMFALPILSYLFTHPQQLWTPRGKEIVVALGPAMGIIVVIFTFQRGIEDRFQVMKNLHSDLQSLAERDPLTGLYNRRAGEQFLDNLQNQNKPDTGLILFDIDHFKIINDTYGHSVGDLVLCEIAQRCSTSLRHDDQLIRWGGEEFLVLFNNINEQDIEFIANSLRTNISNQPIIPVGHVTASFGVTLFNQQETIETLLSRVDQAMYAAKNAGRNCIVNL